MIDGLKIYSSIATIVILMVTAGCSSTVAQVGSAQIGIASYYGAKWHGSTTASGEKMDIHALTAAHKTLPFHTRVRVTLLSTGKSVIVRINDRGPFVKGRIIDLSDEAARRIGLLELGLAKVKVERLK